MNDQEKTIIALDRLGAFLRQFTKKNSHSDPWSLKLNETIALAQHKNAWFTRENVLFALRHWANLLKKDTLTNWLSAYDFEKKTPKRVSIIMAGNIPLVGFHDFISVLITGNTACVKLSSNDDVLYLFIIDYILNIEPLLKSNISITDGILKDFDAVIATGSTNTSRYFEYYFGKVPNIIRKNRNSVAILTGDESKEELAALGEDVFRYFGLGCRSISKIFVPRGYGFDTFFKSIFPFNYLINNAKYANNYDYNKAVYLMSDFKLLDNGFLVLKQDEGYASPIASLFYEYYDDLQPLKARLKKDRDLLQCVVSNGVIKDEIAFGQTQLPSIDTYADDRDTVDFLLKT